MDVDPGGGVDGGLDLASRIAGLSDLWAETLGDPRVVVAVLDGPVDAAHPCFAGADIAPVATLVPAAARGPGMRHGTFVASILFGRHPAPVAGVAPRCRGLVVPVFGDGEGGEIAPSSQTDLARAITQAIGAGATIVNLSGGELSSSPEMAWPLADAMKLCAAEGVLVVAAAGNDGCRCIHVPAAAPSALAVGAMDAGGAPSGFSNFGDAYREHGILAPGEQILGAVAGGGVERRSGTSYAAPIVSGVAALLLSREIGRGRRLRIGEIYDVLLESAVACESPAAPGCDRLFRGRLNIPGAIQLLDARVKMTMMDAVSTGLPEGADRAAAVAPSSSAPAAPAPSGGVSPADCGCGGGGAAGSLVFAIGTLGFDFGTEALRDAFHQANGGPIYDGNDLANYLKTTAEDDNNASDAATVVWTLSIDSYPVYAIKPLGTFADQAYDSLVSALRQTAKGELERISLPGRLTGGSVTLLSGQVIPIVEPDVPGLKSWTTSALVEAAWEASAAPAWVNHVLVKSALRNFLTRVYHERRSSGAPPQDRAVNFAATNAYAACQIFIQAAESGLELLSIETQKSPLCRPESDCWDVMLVFFDPLARARRARQAFRFTVDVSDVEPVQIGDVRTWQVH